MSTFASLQLSSTTLAAIGRLGWKTPSPIQALAIAPAIAGGDVIGCAATGTGKTGAFLLPLIERIGKGEKTQALVLAPTRELALQIAEQFDLLAHGTGLRAVSVIGGVGMEPQVAGLRKPSALIVATPGRLVDHLQRGSAHLSGINLLVLDEADRMLDMGFAKALEQILKKLPSQRQTLLFSATMGKEIADFAKRHLKNPARVEITPSGTTASKVEQRIFRVTKEEKLPLLLALLAEGEESTLVFTRTKHGADKVMKRLQKSGHEATRIHADRSQGQRRAALEGFKDGSFRVLVATDIAARGIDVDGIGQVFNFDLPPAAEDYVHRIGRTGRAGAGGVAISFCTPDDTDSLRSIERLTGKPITRFEPPRDSPIFQAERKRAVAAQLVPGPRQPGHGTSTRKSDRAATHRARKQGGVSRSTG